MGNHYPSFLKQNQNDIIDYLIVSTGSYGKENSTAQAFFLQV